MKDYHDLILLTRHQGIPAPDKLKDAVTKTFFHRGTLFRSIKFDETGLKVLEKLWTAHLQGLGDNAQNFNLPKNLSTLIEEVNRFNEVLKNKKVSLGALVADTKGKQLIKKVREALAAGADVNDDSRNGHRPLQMALTGGYTEVARLLIEHSADLYHRDRSGETPLQAAINHGEFQNAALIIEKGVPFDRWNLQHEFNYVKHYQFIIGH